MPTGEYQRRRDNILAREHRNREEGRLPYWNDRARSINWKAAKRYYITETVTGQQLMDLYLEQNRCLYCGEKLLPKTTHFDHMTPLSKGGSNTIENICTACSECNFIKNDDTADQYIQRVEETGEPAKAYDWVLNHRKEIQIHIDEALTKGVRKIEFDINDYI
jgi:5-methylcytosine-specific restriction endonuclease McrA